MQSSWLVGFYGISTIVSYLMPNPLYTYILIIGFSNSLYVTFLNEPRVISLHTVKWLQAYTNNLIKHQSFVWYCLHSVKMVLSIPIKQE